MASFATALGGGERRSGVHRPDGRRAAPLYRTGRFSTRAALIYLSRAASIRGDCGRQSRPITRRRVSLSGAQKLQLGALLTSCRETLMTPYRVFARRPRRGLITRRGEECPHPPCRLFTVRLTRRGLLLSKRYFRFWRGHCRRDTKVFAADRWSTRDAPSLRDQDRCRLEYAQMWPSASARAAARSAPSSSAIAFPVDAATRTNSRYPCVCDATDRLVVVGVHTPGRLGAQAARAVGRRP